ncbi:MAG: hypothetical protein ACI352_07045 [Elusimicrobiaceae bacterium]
MNEEEQRSFYLDQKRIFYFFALLGQVFLSTFLAPLLIALSTLLAIYHGESYLHIITISSGLLMWMLDNKQLASLILMNEGKQNQPIYTKYTRVLNIIMIISFILNFAR